MPSRAEQALEEAMARSSPLPEPLVGKRAHEEDTDDDEEGDEPDEESRAVADTQPSLSNVSAATLRYATHKKLRTEQRSELDAFLKVRLHQFSFVLLTLTFSRTRHSVARPSYSFVSSL